MKIHKFNTGDFSIFNHMISEHVTFECGNGWSKLLYDALLKLDKCGVTIIDIDIVTHGLKIHCTPSSNRINNIHLVGFLNDKYVSIEEPNALPLIRFVDNVYNREYDMHSYLVYDLSRDEFYSDSLFKIEPELVDTDYIKASLGIYTDLVDYDKNIEIYNVNDIIYETYTSSLFICEQCGNKNSVKAYNSSLCTLCYNGVTNV